jgi:hypothetical protein
VIYFYLKETTKWKDNVPNHTYIFSDKKSIKVLGYIKEGTDEVITFKKALTFNKRYRTFKEVEVK